MTVPSEWWLVPRHQSAVSTAVTVVWITLAVIVTWVSRDTFNAREMTDTRDRIQSLERKSRLTDEDLWKLRKRRATLETQIPKRTKP